MEISSEACKQVLLAVKKFHEREDAPPYGPIVVEGLSDREKRFHADYLNKQGCFQAYQPFGDIQQGGFFVGKLTMRGELMLYSL